MDESFSVLMVPPPPHHLPPMGPSAKHRQASADSKQLPLMKTLIVWVNAPLLATLVSISKSALDVIVHIVSRRQSIELINV